MKKNLLIAAMGLLTMASCTNNEEVNNLIAKNDNAISFDTYVGKATKAGELNAPFGVFAYNGAWNATTSTANFMFNQEVAANGTYSPVKYWPSTPVSFIAYSPYQTASAEGKVLKDYANNTPGLPSMAFSIGTTANTDLLVSNLLKDKTAGPISILLKHALSKVTFTVTSPTVAEGTIIEFKSINIAGMKSNGILAFGETSPTWNTTNGATDAFTSAPNTSYFMIPQALTDVKAQIVYTITTTDDALPDGVFAKEETVNIELGANGISAWDISKQYNYAIKLTLDEVKLSATVEEWTESTPVP